jgi:beta-xylosidase
MHVNPVHDAYFADPFVWRVGDRYYAIGTGAAEAAGDVRDTVFPMLASTDLVHWRTLGDALVRPDAALGDTYWAPEVFEHDGRFFLYYSVGHEDREHQLRVAVSSRPEGPYRDAAGLTDPRTCAFAIDPHPFRDHDGRVYLFHARDFLDEAGGARAGTALVVQELGSDLLHLVGEPTTVLRAHWDWQRFAANRPMYGRTYDWHTLEGPSVLLRDGTYYCMYSGGSWQTAGYGVDWATATSIRGPWVDGGSHEGPRLLRGIPGRVIGPGHHSVVTGPDGELYACYHAWDAAMTARRMCIDRLVVTADGLRCDGPT